MPADVIVLASVASVLLDESSVILLAAPLPTWIDIEPESVSARFEMPASFPVELFVPLPADPVYPSAIPAVSTIEFAVMLMLPLAPELPETRLRREPLESVRTEA